MSSTVSVINLGDILNASSKEDVRLYVPERNLPRTCHGRLPERLSNVIPKTSNFPAILGDDTILENVRRKVVKGNQTYLEPFGFVAHNQLHEILPQLYVMVKPENIEKLAPYLSLKTQLVVIDEEKKTRREKQKAKDRSNLI